MTDEERRIPRHIQLDLSKLEEGDYVSISTGDTNTLTLIACQREDVCRKSVVLKAVYTTHVVGAEFVD